MAVERAVAFDRTRGIGWRHGFAAEHALNSDALAAFGRPVVLAQAVTQLGQKWVVRDAREVVHIDRGLTRRT